MRNVLKGVGRSSLSFLSCSHKPPIPKCCHQGACAGFAQWLNRALLGSPNCRAPILGCIARCASAHTNAWPRSLLLSESPGLRAAVTRACAFALPSRSISAFLLPWASTVPTLRWTRVPLKPCLTRREALKKPMALIEASPWHHVDPRAADLRLTTPSSGRFRATRSSAAQGLVRFLNQPPEV